MLVVKINTSMCNVESKSSSVIPSKVTFDKHFDSSVSGLFLCL